MKTTKVYKTKLGAKLAIGFAKIRNFFGGSHYVAETFTTRFNTETKEYSVEHFTMTRDEEQKFHNAIAEQQAIIAELMETERQTKQTKPQQPKQPKQYKQPKQQPQVKQNNSETPNMNAKPKKKYYKPKGNQQKYNKQKQQQKQTNG